VHPIDLTLKNVRVLTPRPSDLPEGETNVYSTSPIGRENITHIEREVSFLQIMQIELDNLRRADEGWGSRSIVLFTFVGGCPNVD